MEEPTNGGLPERSSINEHNGLLGSEGLSYTEHKPVNKPSGISKFKVLYVRLPSLLVQQFMGVFVCH
jgi:hypothetical protein